jgi:hypothetical protein
LDNGSTTEKVLLVMNKGDVSVIHTLDKQDKITEEYKEVPANQVRLVRKNQVSILKTL